MYYHTSVHVHYIIETDVLKDSKLRCSKLLPNDLDLDLDFDLRP